MEEITEYESFKTALRNIVKNSNRTRVSAHTQYNYRAALKLYLQFVNSEEGLSKQINPDDLILEAQQDIEEVKDKIRLFFLWLQGEPVPGYKSRRRKMRKTSAFTRAYAQIRGFYTNNNIVFGKWKTPNVADMKKEAIENDVTVPFFKREGRKIFLNRGMLKQFLANLKLRDQTVFLCMLSSSQDSIDLFRLTVGDVRKQRNRERFYWEGQRSKTGVRFKTFFSLEATDIVRRYIRQERSDAKNDEPLFLTSTYSGEQRKMKSDNISAVFRDGARKIGVELEDGYQNPFRPKRLRHVFRSACSHAFIERGYINAFMGHRSSISQEYLEKPLMILELEYSKAEHFLTVYGAQETESLEEMRTEINQWKGKYADLKVKVEDLELTLGALSNKFEQRVKEIQQKFNERLDDFFAEYENMTNEVALPEPTREEILRAKEKLSRKE